MKKLYLMTILAVLMLSIVPPSAVEAQSYGYGYNGYTYQLYHGSDNSAAIYAYTPALAYYTSAVYGPYAGYTPVAITSDYYGNSYVLWSGTNSAVVWYLNSAGDYVYGVDSPAYAGWTPAGITSYMYNVGISWTYTNDAYTWYWHITNTYYTGTTSGYNLSYVASAYYATPTNYTYYPPSSSRTLLTVKRSSLVSAAGHEASLVRAAFAMAHPETLQKMLNAPLRAPI